MYRLKDQTNKIGLESSSASYVKQSDYENSVEYQIDTFQDPSQKFPISIDNSDNPGLTMESEILSIGDSINVEDKNETKKFQRENMISRKMTKRREEEVLEIDSKKRRTTETSGSQLGSLMMTFEEGVISPKASNVKSRNIQIKKTKYIYYYLYNF